MTDLTTKELALQANTNVVGHIRKLNAATIKRCEADDNITFYGTICESISERYSNVYEYERDMAASAYSDLFKDINGFHPRNTVNLTLTEIEAKLNAL